MRARLGILLGSLFVLAACQPRGGVAVPAEPRPEVTMPVLDAARASRLVRLSLACADREYPNKPGNILDGDETVKPPRELTPAFFGCFDWHSAVHGHWAMVRVLSRFPGLPEAREVRVVLDAHLTAERLGAELAYFRAERNRGFERPYGWAWLLRLAAELADWDDPAGRRWGLALRPLAVFVAERSMQYLPRLTVPIRSGTHDNTAFAMVHMLDYARRVGDRPFEQLLVRRARELYGADRDCPVHYEPSGEDFISPCLTEADLMRRVLSGPELRQWLAGFLPLLGTPRFETLLRPVAIRDLADPRIGHLMGLGLERAWTLQGIASALPADDPRAPHLRRLAAIHAETSLGQMFDSGYGGEHWLASFAIYLLTSSR